jgi:hypothetical protein
VRTLQRIVLLAALAAAAPLLAGCEDIDMDKFDVFGISKKPPLPGKREDLFPAGVPGVTQGIPPEYQKGYQERQRQAAEAAAAQAAESGGKAQPGAAANKGAAAAPAEKPKPKKRVVAKRKPKPPPAAPAPQPAAQQPAQATWPTTNQPPQQSNQAPWPATQQPQQQTEPWPSAPPSGTFSR